MATVSYRRNLITSLKDDSGIEVLDHEGKAALLWNGFKARMGVACNPVMLFDLNDLITPQDLSSLSSPSAKRKLIMWCPPYHWIKPLVQMGLMACSSRSAGQSLRKIFTSCARTFMMAKLSWSPSMLPSSI
jgi:hypothetical protein